MRPKPVAIVSDLEAHGYKISIDAASLERVVETSASPHRVVW
jgi:hypothetical protein